MNGAVHDPKQLQAVVESAAPPDLELAFRPMFGGIMAYVAGKPFASLSNVGLALKVSGDTQRELLAEPGTKSLQYEPDKPPSKSYVVVAPGMLAEPDKLRPWLVRSVSELPAAKTKHLKP